MENLIITSDLFDLSPSFFTLEARYNEEDNEEVHVDFADNSIRMEAEEESVLRDCTLEAVELLLLNGIDDFNVKRPIKSEFTI